MTREELAARLYVEAADLLVQENKATSIASTVGGAALGSTVSGLAGHAVVKRKFNKEYKKAIDKARKDADKKKNENNDDDEFGFAKNFSKGMDELAANIHAAGKTINTQRVATLAQTAAAIGGGIAGNKINKIIENNVRAKKLVAGKSAKELDQIIEKLEAGIAKFENKSTDPAWKKANKKEYSAAKVALKKAKAAKQKIVKDVKEFVEELEGYGYDYIEESYNDNDSVFDALNDFDLEDFD